MNVLLFNNLIIVLFSVLQFTTTNAKKKSLKIIIPNKIRYVHHHHTHVFVVKEKKPQRENHIHYYDKAKNKGVNHHIYLHHHPPVEDEEEEESLTKYTVTAPNSRREIADSRYHSARELPLVYEEPRYPTYSRKYRFYKRSFDRERPYDDSMEYYDDDPLFPVVKNNRNSFTGRPSDVEYESKSGMSSSDVSYDEDHTYRVRHLYYPDKRFFSKSYNGLLVK